MNRDYASPGDRPNVVLICTDHLRWDWLGCNGHPVVQTPQIDKLAAQGVTFRRAMSECPVCVPARRILMTGRDTHGVSMSENRDTQPFPEGPKLAECVTRAGYQTFASGKLHTWPQRNRIGFEDVALNEEGRRQGDLVSDDYDRWLADRGVAHRAYTHGLGNNQYGVRLSPVPTEYTTTAWTADRAMDFLERRDPTRPFFLYVSFDKPHPPITPPPEYWELYRTLDMPRPVMGEWARQSPPARIRHMRNIFHWDRLRGRPEEIQQTLRGYAAQVTHIDSAIGTIIGALREMGELDNTWFIVLSDHGDQLFDHGNFAKGDHLAGSCRIPYIVVPPPSHPIARSVEGRVDTLHPVGLADIMPTILEIIGAPVPDGVVGRSVVPLLRPNDGGRETAFRTLSFGHCTVSYAVTDGRYRYVWFGDDDREFLFDQEHDATDSIDLISDPAAACDGPGARAALDTLRRAMAARLSDSNDPHAAPEEPNGRVAIPFDWELDRGGAPNVWNNRGRH